MSLDMDRELLETLHVHSEDLPFIAFIPGIETRLLHFNRADGVVVTHIKAQPGAVSSLHRHPSAVYGWTVSGSWGHDHQYLYRPGTYIYETPGVIHQFMCGDTVTEAVYISSGNLEMIDPETHELSVSLPPEVMVEQYVAKCEAIGVKPSVLGL